MSAEVAALELRCPKYQDERPDVESLKALCTYVAAMVTERISVGIPWAVCESRMVLLWK